MCLRNPATFISIVTRYLTDTTERVIAGARKSARARARERKVKERRAEEGVCVCVCDNFDELRGMFWHTAYMRTVE